MIQHHKRPHLNVPQFVIDEWKTRDQNTVAQILMDANWDKACCKLVLRRASCFQFIFDPCKQKYGILTEYYIGMRYIDLYMHSSFRANRLPLWHSLKSSSLRRRLSPFEWRSNGWQRRKWNQSFSGHRFLPSNISNQLSFVKKESYKERVIFRLV